MKCKNLRDDKECGGELIKLKNYYVCTECCKDSISFDVIVQLTKRERGALPEKPKGPSIELLHPEMSGFYTYKISFETEWFTHYTLYGYDGRDKGGLKMEDLYTKADFIIHYKGPYQVVNLINSNGGVDTLSLTPEEIKFYPKKPIYKKEKKEKGMDFNKEKRLVTLTSTKSK